MTLYVHRRKAVPGADVTIYKAKECVTGESSKYLNRKQREEALSSLALATEQLTRMTSSHTSVFTRSGRQKLPAHRKTLGEGGMNNKQSAKLLEVSDDPCYLARLIVPVVGGLAHIWRDCATWWFDRDDLRRESDQVEKSHLAQGKENKASAALCSSAHTWRGRWSTTLIDTKLQTADVIMLKCAMAAHQKPDGSIESAEAL